MSMVINVSGENKKEIPVKGYFEVFDVLSDFPEGTYGTITSNHIDFGWDFASNVLMKALEICFGYSFECFFDLVVFHRTDCRVLKGEKDDARG